MNYESINLDLQSVMKRAYQNLLYRSSFMNFLNTSYLGDVRATGTPKIEIVKQKATTLNVAKGAPVRTEALSPNLTKYDPASVDLTDLRIDYSFRVPSLITATNISGIIDGQIEVNDSEVAMEVDKYGYGKLKTAITGNADGSEAFTKGQVFVWAPSAKEEYISNINTLKATLFNRKIYDNYLLGLEALEYANYVSALTSVLKYETLSGVEAVDRGEVASAFGVSSFEINSNALNDVNVKGFFANEVGTVGDAFFSQFNEFAGNYPGFPGDYVVEGAILFGADVVRPEAIIKLVATA